MPGVTRQQNHTRSQAEARAQSQPLTARRSNQPHEGSAGNPLVCRESTRTLRVMTVSFGTVASAYLHSKAPTTELGAPPPKETRQEGGQQAETKNTQSEQVSARVGMALRKQQTEGARYKRGEIFVRVEQFGAVADDAAVLLARARHEAGNCIVAQREQGQNGVSHNYSAM